MFELYINLIIIALCTLTFIKNGRFNVIGNVVIAVAAVIDTRSQKKINELFNGLLPILCFYLYYNSSKRASDGVAVIMEFLPIIIHISRYTKLFLLLNAYPTRHILFFTSIMIFSFKIDYFSSSSAWLFVITYLSTLIDLPYMSKSFFDMSFVFTSLAIITVSNNVIHATSCSRSGVKFDENVSMNINYVGILAVIFIGTYVYLIPHPQVSSSIRSPAAVCYPYLVSSFVAITIIAMLHVMSRYLDVASPFVWIYYFLVNDNCLRLFLCIYWSICIIASIAFAKYSIVSLQWPQICTRKVFHLTAVAMFAPPLFLTQLKSFLVLAYGVALCALILIEIVRVHLGKYFPDQLEMISVYYGIFIDYRDTSISAFVTSHIYLLVGCASSVWISAAIPVAGDAGYHDVYRVIKHLGWITVGVGDALAAIVGTSLGKTKWRSSSYPNNRSLEGSVAMFFSMMLAVLVVQVFDPFASSTIDVCLVTAMLLLTTLVEAFTTENDNIILPLTAVTSLTSMIMLVH